MATSEHGGMYPWTGKINAIRSLKTRCVVFNLNCNFITIVEKFVLLLSGGGTYKGVCVYVCKQYIVLRKT